MSVENLVLGGLKVSQVYKDRKDLAVSLSFFVLNFTQRIFFLANLLDVASFRISYRELNLNLKVHFYFGTKGGSTLICV